MTKFAWLGFMASGLLALASCTDEGSGETDAAVHADGGHGDPDASSDAAVPADSGTELDAGLVEGDFIADYCTPLASLVCERAAQCGCGAVVPSGELDVPGCVTQYTEQCKEGYAPLLQLVASQGARVFGERARACVARIAQDTPECELPQGTLISFALCEPFFASETPIGSACAGVPLCANGAGTCLEGSCVARVAQDGACAGEFACATGLACLEGTCRALGAAGESCSESLRCAPPLHCVEGECGSLRALGGDCTETSDCASGLDCTDGKCTSRATNTCSDSALCGSLQVCAAPRVCAPRLEQGELCRTDRECQSTLYCSDAGTCEARPSLEQTCARGAICTEELACDPSGAENPLCLALPTADQPCGLTEQGPFACAEGLGCADGICKALPLEGSPCAQPNRCAAGLACDFTAEGSFCVVPKPLGAPCQNDVVCAPGHCGAEGSCVADQADGTPCRLGNECSGVCGPADTGALVCRAALAQDDPCIFDEDCPDTLACRATPARVTCVPELCTAI